LKKGEKEEGGRVIRDAPRTTEAADTVRNRRRNGRYSLKGIPTTTIATYEIQKTVMGTDLWMTVAEDSLSGSVPSTHQVDM
jgi:hypothetical protein